MLSSLLGIDMLVGRLRGGKIPVAENVLGVSAIDPIEEIAESSAGPVQFEISLFDLDTGLLGESQYLPCATSRERWRRERMDSIELPDISQDICQ